MNRLEELNSENVIEKKGRLSDFLNTEFLPGYLRILDEIYPENNYRETLPSAINNIISTVLECPNNEQVNLFGSIARYLIDGMNQRHWGVLKKLINDKKIYSYEQSVNEFFSNPMSFSDPDADLTIKGFTITELESHLQKSFQLDTDSIEISDYQVNGYSFQRRSYIQKFGNYLISVSAGPIPSVPEIQNIVIGIHDQSTMDRLFHFDISEAPATGAAVEREKRQAKTTLWQDMGIVKLSKVAGSVVYEIPEDALDVFNQQDEINSETKDPGDLMEIILRAIRMQGLHQLKFLKIAHNDQTYQLELPNLEMFLPYFKSPKEIGSKIKNIFSARQRIIDFVLNDHKIDNPAVIYLLQKELATCLIVDPYITVQALRDSGIASLIPGLSHITREEWNSILTSRHFVIRGIVTEPSDRTFKLMETEHDNYVSQSPPYLGHYSGLERFIRALQEVNKQSYTNPWVTYLNLWSEASRRSKPKKSFRDLIDLGINGSNTNTLNLISLASQNSYLEDLLYNVKSQQAKKILLSIGYLYEFIKYFPSGVTPRQMKRVYEQISTVQFLSADFTEIFLHLKSLGLIDRFNQNRIDQEGRLDDITHYTVRPSVIVDKLSHLAIKVYFIDYVKSDKTSEVFRNVNPDLKWEFVSSLIREFTDIIGIPTVQALRSYGREDFERLANNTRALNLPMTASEIESKVNLFLNLYDKRY